MSDDMGFGTDGAHAGGMSDVPDEQAELDQIEFEIEFFESVLESAPEFVEVLQVLGSHYTEVGQYDEGLMIDRRLVRLCPEDAIAHYNLACSLSLTGRPAEAVRKLDAAVRLGYRDLDYMDSDPDLDNVRNHQAYIRFIRQLRQS